MNTPLSTFPAPLLRLILCGGGGLAPAWGPLKDTLGMTWPWDPHDEDIAWPPGCPSGTRDIWCQPPLDAPQQWSIPLDTDCPWPARLALVAAWMAHSSAANSALFAAIARSEGSHYLTLWIMVDPRNRVLCRWRISTGDSDYCRFEGGDGTWSSNPLVRHMPPLPTLPSHLYAHPPTVALLLALWDIPEIRARIEAT